MVANAEFCRLPKAGGQIGAGVQKVGQAGNEDQQPARTIVGLLAKIRVACLAAVFDDQDATIQVALRDALKMGDDLGWPGCELAWQHRGGEQEGVQS